MRKSAATVLHFSLILFLRVSDGEDFKQIGLAVKYQFWDRLLDDSLTIFDGPSGDKLITLTKQDGVGACGMWSPDSGRIVTVSAEGEVKQWGSLRADRNKSNSAVDFEPILANQLIELQKSELKSQSPSMVSDSRIEGETLYVQHCDAGKAFAQDMGSFGRDNWSGGQQLLWIDGKPNDQLSLGFDLSTTGDYKLGIVLTTAPDFAIVDLKLNDFVISEDIDLYRPNAVGTTGKLECGTYALKSGRQQLTIKIKGANASSLRKYGIGIDYLEFSLVKPGPSSVEQNAIKSKTKSGPVTDLIPSKLDVVAPENKPIQMNSTAPNMLPAVRGAAER